MREKVRHRSRPMSYVVSVVSALVVAYLGIAAYAYFNQANLLYRPDFLGRTVTTTPAAIGLDHEPVELTTTDQVAIHGWYVPAEPERAVVAFFHGNAGNIGHRLETLSLLNELGLSTLIIDYRGYGQSEGKPSEAGTYRDAEAAWRYLTEQRGIAPGRIVLFGRSLGSAVAAHLAARHEAGAVVLESAFTSLPDLAAELYPYLPARLLSRFRYPTAENIARTRAPVLVIHGQADELTPLHHGQEVFERAPEPKRLVTLEGGHNTGFLGNEAVYRRAWADFLDRHIDRPGEQNQ
jgi:hypothetical protein